MQGIDILSKTEIMARSTTVEIAINIMVIIVAASAILSLIFLISERIVLGCACLGLLAIAFTAIKILNCVSDTVKTGRYQYKVTINDSVSFNDLYEKYDVVDQDGKIFIIEDKEK